MPKTNERSAFQVHRNDEPIVSPVHDARELHIGGHAAPVNVFNGDQYVHGLMFQFEGKVYPISKLHPDHIQELFRRSRQARHTASLVGATRTVIWMVFTFLAALWVAAAPKSSPKEMLAAVIAFAVLAACGWAYASALVGPSARIQRRVRRELEEREALLRVELALITPHRRRSWREVWRAWREAMRG
jgi:hypothetical protein